MAAISVQGLRKTYAGGKDAVRGLDLEIQEGGFHGLLGPNGAGKTTTIGAITGLVRPTAGNVLVHGHDAWSDAAAARRHLGVCPQEPNFDDFLGLEKILAYHAGYFGMPYAKAIDKARDMLRTFDLYEYRQKRSSTLSGGMKRRLLLARALMHEPDILILDEPTAGVDVEIRRSLWEHVRRLNDEGTTVLLTTHYLEEAEQLCDDITVINHGQVIETGSPAQLQQRYGHRMVSVTASKMPAGFDAGDIGFRVEDNVFVHESTDPTPALRAILRRLDEVGAHVSDVDVSGSRLEDIFMHLTARERERT